MSRALFFALAFCLIFTSTFVNAKKDNQKCETQEGLPGECQPLAACFYQYGDLETLNGSRCSLGSKAQLGVCCPTRDYRPAGDVPFNFGPPEWPVIKLPIEKAQVFEAVTRAETKIKAYIKKESNSIPQGNSKRPNTMASIHKSVFGQPPNNQQALNLNGLRTQEVTRILSDRFRLNPLESRDGLSQFDLYDTPFEQFCPAIPKCYPRDKYRTHDGSCNNLENPLWGMSNTQFNRVMPPVYADGISTFRESITGGPLPLASVLSTELTSTSSKTDRNLNVMFVQWGQLVAHETTLGAVPFDANGQLPVCCNQPNPENPTNPVCSPIMIPPKDPFYAQFNHTCNEFLRDVGGPKNDCKLGARDQINQITAFIDASMVYGNEANRSQVVRTFKDGLLLVSRVNKRDFLPYDTKNYSPGCAVPADVQPPGDGQPRCIFSGDTRVNQQIGLVTLQLFFLREHNRLARELKRINRHWSDETLYQEARRIVGAEIQHITYNEYLPLALGRRVMKASSLFLQPIGHSNGYNPLLNPSIVNEYAAATYRWHTVVQGFYKLLSPHGHPKDRVDMHRIFNDPTMLYRDGAIDETTYGMVAQKSEAFDPIFVDDIKNLLFPLPNASFGLDLVAMNIQRGRDHGMPPYNEVRHACGLRPVRNFAQLNAIFRPGMAKKFEQFYKHVDDIDLFVGGVNEIPLPEGIVGPTFSCIVAEQFRRLKYGDRFWYENGNMSHSFTRAQLRELRKVTLSGVVCANGDRIRKMQPFAMIVKSGINRNIDCKLFQQINLKHWKE